MAGRKYATDGAQNAAASESVLTLTTGATTIRPTLYEVIFGSSATPADQAFNMQLNRHTAEGTNTTVTPQPLDPGDPAATVDGGENHTAEPTYTAGAALMSFSVNQQATFHWQVPPDEGFIMPATATAGIGLRFVTVSGGTALCEAQMYHEE